MKRVGRFVIRIIGLPLFLLISAGVCVGWLFDTDEQVANKFFKKILLHMWWI